MLNTNIFFEKIIKLKILKVKKIWISSTTITNNLIKSNSCNERVEIIN